MFRKNKNSYAPDTNKPYPNGQVILEFTFCMIVVMLMLFGLARVFIWSGSDTASRRIAHDQLLRADPNNQPCADMPNLCAIGVCTDCSSGSVEIARIFSPIQQIDPYFYKTTSMNAIWKK